MNKYKILEVITVTVGDSTMDYKVGDIHEFSDPIAKKLLEEKVIEPVLTVIRSTDPNDELCESCQ